MFCVRIVGSFAGLLALLLSPVEAFAANRPSLARPPVVSSWDRVLRLTLEAAPGRVDLDGKTYAAELYNGLYIPPLLRIRPGETMEVRLINQLARTTNLHFHGMGVSPLDNGDNVFVHVHPGESFDYQVPVPIDKEQHPGLFWYHPHAHGSSAEQVAGGMSGAIVVEGADQFYPFLKNIREQVLLIKHLPQPRDPKTSTVNTAGEIVSVNGQMDPAISIRPGEMQFWRIGNIGANLFYKLHIIGLPMYVVATDGHWLSHPTKRDSALIGPGGRIEVVMVGTTPGEYPLLSEPFKEGESEPPNPERRLATAVVEGDPAGVLADAETELRSQKLNQSRLIDVIRRSPIDLRRTLTFSRNPQKTEFYIDGKMFDESRTDIVAKLGTTEEWTLVNEDDQIHNFHIHQTMFLVTELDGVPRQEDSLFDTYTLPERRPDKPSVVKVIIPFTDPLIVGRFVFHCHVLKHEDKGMMGTIEVVR